MSTSWDPARFSEWVAVLESEIDERPEAIRLVLLALCANTHVLLLGPPGTGKSMLARAATRTVDGTLFQTLLTRFSVPEDVLGPLSIEALDQGRYERLIEGYLPAADVAFVDEVYKANAAILNSLLSILNERSFFDGSKVRTVPLRSMIAASNEVPAEDAGLDALDDRLLLRIEVKGLSDRALFDRIRGKRATRPKEPPRLDGPWLETLRVRASQVRVGEGVTQLILGILRDVRGKTIAVSDRRLLATVEVLKVMAVLAGDDEVLPSMLGVLRYSLWRNPEHASIVDDAMERQLGHSEPLAKASAYINEVIQQLETRQRAYWGRQPLGPDEVREFQHKIATFDGDVEKAREFIRQRELGRSPLWAPLLPLRHADFDALDAKRAQLIERIKATNPDFAVSPPTGGKGR